jgi:hypothetical protein
MITQTRLLWLVLAPVVTCAADDPPVKPSAAEPKKQAQVTPAQLADLIRRLDSPEFAERQAASRQLESAGRAAIPALAEAAQGDSAEVTTRAIAILRKQLREGDSAARAAAQAGLEAVAAGTKPAAARAAQEALDAGRDDTPTIAPLAGIPFGGQLELNAMFGGRRFQSFTSSMVNGERVVHVREEGRRIVITDSPTRGIRIEITEPKDGKDQLTKYEAKDADELQKKNPDIHKVYIDYTKSQVRPRERLGLLGLPIARPAVSAVPSTRELAQQVEKIQQQLQSATQIIEQQSRSGDAEKLKQALQTLEETRKQLDDLSAKLRRGIER